MTIYVDPLRPYPQEWCHLATDGDLDELHTFARRIGLKRSWFRAHPLPPHYDLTAAKRARALNAGAVPVSSQDLVDRCSDTFKGKGSHD